MTLQHASTHHSLLAKIIQSLLPVLFIGVAIPLLAGRVSPNALYGVRTAKTMASPELWYRANRAAGRAIVIATLACVLLGWGAMLLVPVDPSTRSAIDTILLCVANVAALLIASARAGAF